MSDTQKKRRAPGRPKQDLDLRERLLDVARTEFAAHGFRGTSMQAIAEAADATPAMVHYYFDNKLGLYRAMLQHTLGPVLATMQAVVARAGTTEDPIAAFLRGYMTQLAMRPEIPALLLKDVLSPDAEMRDEFISGFATRGAGIVTGLIRQGVADGRLRADLDPQRTALSLMSMAVFPFLAAPVVEKLFGHKPNPETVDALAAHTLSLFYQGAGVHP